MICYKVSQTSKLNVSFNCLFQPIFAYFIDRVVYNYKMYYQILLLLLKS